MPRTSTRLRHFTESVIRRMTRVANASGAINLSQGFPDFDPPPALLEAAERAARHGPHQYAVTWGAPNFRAALARKQSRYMGLALDPDAHFVVTCGSTEAMMVAMMTACDPGDKVVIFSPFYENYTADAILCGADPIYVPLRPPDFRFDPDDLRRAFAQKPRALVLCNPANPSGKVFTRDELSVLAELVVVGVAPERPTVRDTGANIDTPIAHLFTVRNGKVVRWEGFSDSARVAEAHIGRAAAAR